METIKNTTGKEMIARLSNPNAETTIVVIPDGGCMYTAQQVQIVDSHAEALAGETGFTYGLEDLPVLGEDVYINTYYKHNGKIVFCRQTHERTEHEPEETPALFYFYRENPEGMEWIEQEMVSVGDTRTYEGETYEVIQGHVTQSDWPPDSTPTLWKIASTGEIPVWVQPTGGHDAYNIGDEVMFPDADGTHYRSVINANVWSPTVYPAGWEVVV